MWGTSSNDFYVVGQVGVTESGVIHHYVNGDWAEPVTTTRRLFSIWGSGSTVYAVSRGGIVATFENGAWREQTIGAQPELRSISGSNGDAIAVSAKGQIWRISPR